MGILVPLKMYALVLILTLVVLAAYEEIGNPSTKVSKVVRAALGHHDLHEFLAQKSIEFDMPHDDQVPECDYKTMTAKRFFNDFVKTNRPCLFKGYGR